MKQSLSMVWMVVWVWATWILATPAEAELYRCVDAKGNVTFTGDAHSCRGRAERHETRRELQRTGPAASAPLSLRERRRPRAAPPDPREGAAAMWKRKRGDAEAQLAQIESVAPQWARLEANCNRGADTWYTDKAGIKHTVRCDELKAERHRLEAERARLRDYLNGGLEEECRRAGCLPGWIR